MTSTDAYAADEHGTFFEPSNMNDLPPMLPALRSLYGRSESA